MSRISLLVDEFTHPPRYPVTRDNGKIEMMPTMSLLERLKEAKTRGLKSSGGSVSGMKIPVNATAHDIETDIIRTIHNTSSVHDRYALASLPLGERLKLWSNLGEEATVYAWLEYWRGAIVSLDSTTLFIKGACPECGEKSFLEEREDGIVRKDAIMCVTTPLPAGTDMCASCLVCGAQWQGGSEVMELSTKM